MLTGERRESIERLVDCDMTIIAFDIHFGLFAIFNVKDVFRHRTLRR
jgi:hypothetical protein